MGLGFSRDLSDASDRTPALSILSVGDVQRHFARELHDQVAHPLIELVLAIRELRSSRSGDGDPELERLEAQARTVLRQTRQMMTDLRDRGELRTDDLPAALRSAIGTSPGQKVDLHVTSRWPQSIDGRAAFNLLRIVEQAVVNAVRHGRAERIEVILDVGPTNEAVVIISDDGRGIDDARGGFGVLGMQERATIVGGTFSATAQKTGGTRVEVRVPVDRLR